MGDTLPLHRRGHALEGVSRHGRATPVRGPPAGGREDGGAVRGVRDLPQDRLQDLSSATRTAASTGSPTAAGGRIGTRISCRWSIEKRIVRLKREYPGWGAPEDPRAAAAALSGRARARRSAPCMRCSTATAWCTPARRAGAPRPRAPRLSRPPTPNALWCADYKGEFMLGNRRYCYPLTITDFASRYLLACEALSTTQERYAFTRLRARVQGVRPAARRSAPTTACPSRRRHALYGLSKLAVWWLRLGHSASSASSRAIPSRTAGTSACISRSSSEATKPAAPNVLQQQARFDAFVAAATTTSGRIRRSA